MKKHLFVILLGFLSPAFKSQVEFSPPGAEWSYSFFQWPFTFQNYKIKYVKDTLEGTEKVKILQTRGVYRMGNDCFNGPDPLKVYTKQRGDTVYFKHLRTPGWQILYNFAADVNEYWLATVLDGKNEPMNCAFWVDSVTTVIVNGNSLKRMVLTMYRLGGTEKMTITEKFGNLGFLFNFDNFHCSSDPDQFISFLCYKDSSFGTMQFTGLPCEYKDHVYVTEELNNAGYFSVSPNPATYEFKLSFRHPVLQQARYRITDGMGRELAAGILNSGIAAKLSTANLANGLYFISLVIEGGKTEYRSIVIMK